ncbi:rhomboid family intramembrane serine protease [Natranaeroarchaeum aerophilus]|uniref:Rhomboid family intramembrane serine protease n=1 Tax=Natranaeroarchaeum aerophilus TaxID=2917711 RepID=A0AAE3K4W6_9EURY|nr:rhomboid family intramembrane serine protease [Natranaeroarchaeum aerophilus]MCL9812965.1 rhomboid family intramembrane serine protease [Natranaeroarchaeum aerophilus]
MALRSWALGGSLVLAFVLAFAAVVYLDRPNGRWGRQARSRLLLGIPWGTLVSVLFVLSVYLFLQDGLSNWSDPLVIPYRSWSYFYPTGWLASGFAHASPGHIIGNLTSAIVLASIAEYAWGHFPADRGSQSFASWRTNPWIRAFAVFPAVVLLVGLATSLFALGPVIGFSGVVFAFAGFAIVHYPIVTIVGILVSRVVATVLQGLLDPITVAATSASAPSAPSWASIAIQGHALGFLLGIVLGLFVLSRRDRRPNAARLLGATLIFGVVQGLHLVYWFRGGGEYVLFRGPGVTLVVILALFVTLAVTASERRFVRSTTRRGVALTLVILAVAALAGPAIIPNLAVVEHADLGEDAVTVEDYQITYDEEVRNEMVYVGEVELFGESTAVNTSGVIVTSEDREIWMTHTSKQGLEFRGSTEVKVGGPGWSETVPVERTGWTPTGNESVYQVSVGEDERSVFASEEKRASPRIDGRSVSVVPEDGEFVLAVAEGGDELDRTQLPAENETVAAGGVTFERDQSGDRTAIVAERGETSIEVARAERRGF